MPRQTGPKDWSPRDSEAARELRGRIKRAIERADREFWAEIAKSFPELKSGDFPSDKALEWREAVDNAVYWWLDWNHPKAALIRSLRR